VTGAWLAHLRMGRVARREGQNPFRRPWLPLSRAVHAFDIVYGRLMSYEQERPMPERPPATSHRNREAALRRAVAAGAAAVAVTAGFFVTDYPQATSHLTIAGPRTRLSWGIAPYEVNSNPAVSGGFIFVYGESDDSVPDLAAGNGAFYSKVYALSDSADLAKWTFPFVGIGGAPGPVVADGIVCIIGAEKVYALNENTGRLMWTRDTVYDISAEPVISGANVYFPDQAGDVYSLSAKTGELQWEDHLPAGGDSGTGVAVVNGTVYVNDENGWLYALRAADGRERWLRSASFGFGPTVVADTIYDADYFDSANPGLHALNALNGRTLWTYSAPGGDLDGFSTNPIVNGNSVYIGGESGSLYAIDIHTGKLRWSYATAGDLPIAFVGASRSLIFVESINGGGYAINANDGRLEWEYHNGLAGIIIDSVGPSTVVGGTVYCGIRDSVVALGGGPT